MKNGFADSIFSVIQDHPSVAAGTVTFAVAFSLVAGNAFYAQSGTHPVPLWATRDATYTHSVEKTVRPVKTKIVKPKAANIPIPATKQDIAAIKVASKPSVVVAAVQKALIATGDFGGEVDGLMGPVTRKAIIGYQKRHGFEETGRASKLLLSSIEQNLPVVTKQSGGLAGLIAANQTSSSPQYNKDLVREIQSGLANKGAEIAVDGIFGSRTKAAIANFQRKHKLDVTGTPDKSVLKTLKRVGALDG